MPSASVFSLLQNLPRREQSNLLTDKTFLKLPQDVLTNCGAGASEGHDDNDDELQGVKSFLEKRLKKSVLGSVVDQLNKRYPLLKGEYRTLKKRIRRRGCPKNQTLSNRKKRALGLYTIERKGLQFKDLVPLHEMWKSYMEGYLNLRKHKEFSGDVTQNLTEEIGLLLYKADYHGAFIRVVQSKAPSLVGISGILVFETKNTLKLLGKDNITRCIPKASCEFELDVGHLTLKFLGKNFLVKSPERSAKKLRGNKGFQL